jgi:SAM-dependent methyltransferase
MNHDLFAFETAVDQLISDAQIEPALAAIRELVDALGSDASATGSVLRSHTLDQLCGKIGSVCLDYLRAENILPPIAEEQAEIIVLATELHNIGGHSRVVEDIIRMHRGKRVLILMTNFFTRDYGFSTDRFAALGAEIRLAPTGTYTDRLVWAQMQLACHPDAQVLVFNHHADAGAIAAIQPGLNREVVFCHHADHNLCLGAHLTWVRHVDFFDAYCMSCRNAGLAAELWPLSIPDSGARSHDAASFRSTGPLITCTSGHEVKFTQSYPIHYWEVLPEILLATGGSHIHIGTLSDNILQTILSGLRTRGISERRFDYIPWVESVGGTLKQLGVDLYIGSFPIGGGRATIEAMAAGIPIVMHEHSLLPMLGCTGLGPSNTWHWASLAELQEIIAKATPEELSARSQQVREYYLRQHSPAAFNAAILGETTLTPEAGATHNSDALASYLLRAQVRHETFPSVFDFLDKEQQSMSVSTPAANPLATGIALLDAGRLVEANEALMEALAAQPGDPATLFQLGRLAFAAGMPEDGVNILTEAGTLSAAVLPDILHFGETLVQKGDIAEGGLILSVARQLVAALRPSGTPAEGLARIRALTDNEWLSVLCQSHQLPDYHGFPMPGFPSDQFQINTMGSSNDSAMREAWMFYRAVLPFVNRMRPLEERALLDFGTGWGRFPRTFVKIFEPNNIWGLDVDPAMIKVCKETFSFGNFLVGEPFPPSPLESNQFDLITAYSVFSHLSEEAANKWMHEFARILRPGGIVAFTTQGRDFINQCAYFRQQPELTHEWHKCLAKSFIDETASYANYDDGKFLFSATGGGDTRPSTFYGEALIPPGYMIRQWADIFDLLTFIDDRNIMPQAFTILRKK